MIRSVLLLALLFAVGLHTSLTAQDLLLNEISAANVTHPDTEDDTHDWVEIHNRSTVPLSLDGFTLTDDPLTPEKYALPDITLPPNAYVLVWASGKNLTDTQPPYDSLHAGFKIAAERPFILIFKQKRYKICITLLRQTTGNH